MIRWGQIADAISSRKHFFLHCFCCFCCCCFCYCCTSENNSIPLLGNMPLIFYKCCNFAHFWPFCCKLLQIVQICDICTRSQSDQVRVIWWSRSRKLTSSRRQFATVCIIKPQLYCVTGLWTISLINQLGPAPKDRA